MPGEISEIKLVNFRVFENESFELRPITILTGTNNSGKSSIVKALLLLCANEDFSTLDFSKGLHNLGNFDLTLNNQLSEKDIKNMQFHFAFNSKNKDKEVIFPMHNLNQIYHQLSLCYLKDGENGYLNIMRMMLNGTSVFQISKYSNKKNNENILKFNIDFSFLFSENRKCWFKFSNENAHDLFAVNFAPLDPTDDFKYLLETFLKDEIVELIKDTYPINYVNMVITMIEEIIFSVFYLPNNKAIPSEDNNKSVFDEFLGALQMIDDLSLYNLQWYKFEDAFTIAKNNELINGKLDETLMLPILKLIKDKTSKELVNANLGQFVLSTLKELKKLFRFTEDNLSLKYIPAVRSGGERIISSHSDSFVFNNQLNNFKNFYQNELVADFINFWIKKFDLGDYFDYERIEGVASRFFIIKNNKKTALADMGYGTSQIIPIIISLAELIWLQTQNQHSNYLNNQKILIVEEPETNLHPKLQSMIADMIVDAISKINSEVAYFSTFGFKIIIETHSEYLIRKLQYLTAKKEIAPSDTVIYYLNSPKVVKETGTEQVVKIEIKKDGSLTNDFGPGFFDEAIRLQLELMHMHNQN